MKSPRPHDSSLQQKAYQFIQQRILSGRLPGGSLISEVSLAREIGVSRTPVREAIGQLVAEGFLERVAGRGAAVVQLGRDDLIELYELREALEVYAVGKVARQGPQPADFAAAEEACEQIRQMAAVLESSGRPRLDDSEMQNFLATDLRFHMLLLRMAGNRRLMKVVGDSRLLIRIFSYRREGHDAAQLHGIYRYHREVLDAIGSGDAARAMQLLGEHIQLSKQERLQAYDRWEREHELKRMIALPQALLERFNPAGIEPQPEAPALRGHSKPRPRR